MKPDAGCRMLTAETNAAIAGFFDGGATEVVAFDGHGSGGSLRGELLDPRAMLQRGVPLQWPLFGDYDAIAFVGQHPKIGSDFAHMAHTQMFDAIDFRLNDVSIGEYGQLTLAAAEENIPSIFVSGCDAMRREAEAFSPGAVAVAVKFGLNPAAPTTMSSPQTKDAQLAAVHLSPERACCLIREGACKAARKLLQEGRKAFPIPAFSAPYYAEAEYRANDEMTEAMFGKLPARRIRTREHDLVSDVLREFYREIEWIQPDGDRVVEL